MKLEKVGSVLQMRDKFRVSKKQSYNFSFVVLVTIIVLLIAFIIHRSINPKIVEVPKEIIVEKEVITEVVVEKEPTYVYNITSAEREMLARLVYREANVESLECQKAVVSVVINRWKNGAWGDTLEKVVYSKGQFSPAHLIPTTTPTEKNYKAVDYVLKNGCTVPEYIMYFRANYHFKWSGYVPYKKIDKTCFGYLSKNKE